MRALGLLAVTLPADDPDAVRQWRSQELVDDVAAIVAEARDRIAALLAGVAHNKVLATQLALGQRDREAATATDIPWHLHAASTLVSGMVVA